MPVEALKISPAAEVMQNHPDTLDRFLRRIHRRWIALRAIESAGVGAAIGSAAALALVPVLLWRNQPAAGVALMLMAVTAASGLLYGLLRRPTLLAAAVEADRQLALHDLLATALASRGGTDSWSNAVVAQAHRRCQTLSPDAILLNRLGVRAWSGIGLAAALVLTLSLLSTQPETLSASANRTSVQAAGKQRTEKHGSQAPRHDQHQPGARDDTTANDAPGAAAHAAGDDASDTGSVGGDHSSGSSGESTGSGLGNSRTADAAAVDATSAHEAKASNRPDLAPNVTDTAGEHPAAAGGGSAALAEDGLSPGHGSTAEAGAPQHVAPWSSPAWPLARREAQRTLENGQVPEPYRELVRGYFEPR